MGISKINQKHTVMLSDGNILLWEHMLDEDLSPKNNRRGRFTLKTVQPFFRFDGKLWLNFLTFAGQIDIPIHKPTYKW